MSWRNNEDYHIGVLNELYFNDLADCSFSFCSYDAQNDAYIVEIKERGFPSTSKYVDEGLILEKKKYDKLIKKGEELGKIPLYINHFTDKKYFIWDLALVKPQWVTKNLRKTTKGDTQRVDKVVHFLKREDIINNI